MKKFVYGDQVRLTDHRAWKDFYDDHYVGMSVRWQRFWDENVDRQFTVIGEGDDGGVLLEGLPDYVEQDMNFYSHELEGEVGVFNHYGSLFKV